MSTDPKFGQLIEDDSKERDAVHVAVVPVTADCTVFPGQHVGLQPGSDDCVCWSDNPIGIVDPFLKHRVERGDWFWLFLYPGTITSLRHMWSHPAFPAVDTSVIDDPRVLAARRWFTDFCWRYNASECCYEYPIGVAQLLDLGREAFKSGNWIECGNNQTMCEALREQSQEFWRNWSIIEGVEVPASGDGPGFSCSC